MSDRSKSTVEPTDPLSAGTGGTESGKSAAHPAEPAGERVAKVIARAGICSRRDAELLVVDGRVSVNGRTITSPALNIVAGDIVSVDGKPLAEPERVRVWRYHKPSGLMTTHRDPEGRPTVFDHLPTTLPRVISVGRLDMTSEGLLLLTNDGELARRLELPSTAWTRRYRVRAFGKIDQAALDSLMLGVTIAGVKYGRIEAKFEREQGDNTWLTMVLREGKNREVRKVLEHLGLTVNRLIRVSYGPFQLGELERGQVEEIPSKVLRDQLGERLTEGLTGLKPGRPASGAEQERTESATKQRLRTTGNRKSPAGGRSHDKPRRDAPDARSERSDPTGRQRPGTADRGKPPFGARSIEPTRRQADARQERPEPPVRSRPSTTARHNPTLGARFEDKSRSDAPGARSERAEPVSRQRPGTEGRGKPPFGARTNDTTRRQADARPERGEPTGRSRPGTEARGKQPFGARADDRPRREAAGGRPERPEATGRQRPGTADRGKPPFGPRASADVRNDDKPRRDPRPARDQKSSSGPGRPRNPASADRKGGAGLKGKPMRAGADRDTPVSGRPTRPSGGGPRRGGPTGGSGSAGNKRGGDAHRRR